MSISNISKMYLDSYNNFSKITVGLTPLKVFNFVCLTSALETVSITKSYYQFYHLYKIILTEDKKKDTF